MVILPLVGGLGAAKAASLVSFTLNPTDVQGGTSSTGTVTLDGLAPAGGFDVSLTSDSTYAVVQAKVTVQAGTMAASFQIKTYPVADPAPFVVPVHIRASHSPVTKSNILGVFPPSVMSVELAGTATGGNTLTGRVTISGPAASGGAKVGLSSNSAAATVPAEVVVPKGTQATNFPVAIVPVQTLTSATISAQRNPFNVVTATVAVSPPALRSLVCNPAKGDATSICTLSLTGPAPWGAVIALSSSNPAVVTVPATFTVRAATANFFTKTKRVSTPTDVEISASYGGKAVSDSVQVTRSGVTP